MLAVRGCGRANLSEPAHSFVPVTDELPFAPARPAVERVAPPEVIVRRSSRRRRTVSAHREGDAIVVSVPARLSAAEERRWVDTMVTRVVARERRSRPGDAELAERSARLSARFFGGRARPASVVWSEAQRSRWGSCTPADATIRLSSRLRGMPEWVLDYVLVHELAHLLEPDHSPEFWALVEQYPRAERAKGYLEGHEAAVRAGQSASGLEPTEID